MLLTAQIWDAQKQELAERVGATSRRIASKVAEVLHAGKTATRRQGYRFKLGTKTSGVTVGRCPLWVKSGLMQCNNAGPLGPIADVRLIRTRALRTRRSVPTS